MAVNEKKSIEPSKAVKIFWKIFLYAWGFVFLLIFLIYVGLFGKLPSIEELENPSLMSSSEIYADDGTLMGKFYLKDRINVKYQDISPFVIRALIATEDERFYDHSGIDIKSLVRAVIFLGREGGASTITQQTAKALLGQQSRKSVTRVIEKLKEWIVAIRLEKNFTKEEIITLYLNMVNYGEETYGIRNAAKTYFQKEPGQLAVEEAAVLVGVLKGSTRYNPRRNPKAAMSRRNTVLDQMVRNDFLTKDEAKSLKMAPIQLKYSKMDENSGIAPYFREMLRDDLKDWCKENENPKTGEPYDLYRDGLKIFTTINPKMQEYAEIAVYRHMQNLQKVFSNQYNIKDGSAWKTKEGKAVMDAAIKQTERWKNLKEEGIDEEEIRKIFMEPVNMRVFAWNEKREKDTLMSPIDSIRYHKQIMQIGLLSIDPLSGEVKAWVGGSNFKRFKFDHVNINTKRQVGSTFKPLLYTLGVKNGFKPETELPNGPIDMGGKMIDGTGGPMAVCLALSKNPGAVYLINTLGVKKTIEFAKECGIVNNIPPYPSIALGSADLSLIEMVQAFSMFPGRGFNVKPYYISRIEDRNGNVLASFRTQTKEVISESEAYIMTKMLQGVVDFGTGSSLRWAYGVNNEVAGKTGTTNDNADGWFIGFSPQLLSGVWVGCDDPFLRMLYTAGGSQMAMPAWAYYYQQVFNDRSLNIDPNARFSPPANMQNEMLFNIDSLKSSEELLPIEGEERYKQDQLVEIPISSGKEKVVTESQKFEDPSESTGAPKPMPLMPGEQQKQNSPADTSKNKKGVLKRVFGKT
ncbi:penicillin-binding protein 1A [Bacteroidota bacterium]|nr:penicillin-binding protein 1A [Bacteroidota bacterium]